MKKTTRILSLALCLMLLCGVLPTSATAAATAWDGKTIDVSWYSRDGTQFTISTPEQLMGLAAIVNGIYNKEITTIIGDKSFIAPNIGAGADSGGGNNQSTDTYHYGADDFNGKTVRLAADLDMGGTYNAALDIWTGPNYMPIGGQYLMEINNAATKLGSSFCGTLDGGGHTVYNIYCNRRCTTGNFGDGQSVGLVGRLGVHDNDPAGIRPENPAVRNLAVTGYIYANRSVGGIVGKTGRTVSGAVIENCANFATVKNTDAKGCGGIVGAGWNGGIVRNCYNAGAVTSTYTCPTGGIAGSNEIAIENCYSVGEISASRDSYAMAIGTNNGGGNRADNCYWLTGSAPGGGYYGMNDGSVTELSEAEMQSAALVAKLGGAFAEDTKGINGGYPILAWQARTPDAFGDVAPEAWYADAVRYVMDAGLFDASDGKFRPEAPMTREMMVTALTRLGGDASKITDGTNPQGTITREQIATMMHRFAGLPGAVADLSRFPDGGEVSDWAKDAMVWAVANKIINGSDGKLLPLGTATRAQVAQILYNYAPAS